MEQKPESKWCGASFQLTDDVNRNELWIWRNHNHVTVSTHLIEIKYDDIEETYKELSSKCYEVLTPITHFYGGIEMNLIDPDANTVLFERLMTLRTQTTPSNDEIKSLLGAVFSKILSSLI